MSGSDGKAGNGLHAPKRTAVRDLRWLPATVVLAILVLSVYWQVGGHPFINIDDDVYVYGNSFVLRGLTLDGAYQAFTTFHAANWHPLTWLSHMLDVELFGPSAGWPHRMNVLYHLLNTELLFFVLWRMTGGLWQSAFVAALFGVHPLHVESVAWVAERKDVLSTLFWILTMGAYLRYVRRPGIGRYLLVAAAFALGLLCKPMLVTLPFALLLLDGWPLGRMAPADPSAPPSWRRAAPVFLRLAREKVPLLGLSALSCVVTYLAQAEVGAVTRLALIPFPSRISNAFISYVAYLGKMAWPSSLAVMYLHPASIHVEVPGWEIAGSILLLCALSIVALRERRRRPYLATGWLWYLGTLVPVIGVVQLSGQAMADRYTYVTLIGIFIAVVWGVSEAVSRRRFRQFALGVSALAVLGLSAAAWTQAGYWRDSVTLMSRTAAVTDRNWFALASLGDAFAQAGQYRQAVEYSREALRINPDSCLAWYTLGVSYGNFGQVGQAMEYFQEAVRAKPEFAEGWNNLGISYGRLGQYGKAIDSLREAVRIKPDFADSWYNLGFFYGKIGRRQQAIECFREALRIRPDYPEARNGLAEAGGSSALSP
jgi:Flp pilus assembly protein TadD